MDQMLERLAGNQYYCFLDGFSGYFQIPIDLKDQEKTTLACPYITFAYRRMPFGLCNAPATFQRSSEGVYIASKPLTFSRLATMDPSGDIMAKITLPRRNSWILKTYAKGFCPPVFTSLASFGNHISKSNRTSVIF
nr:reverse transcriptase domain-containing protein [Tanacetum cinerariifolium]